MRRENIFVVSARAKDAVGNARGPVKNYVVCASTEASVHLLFGAKVPNATITSTTTLLALEQTAAKVRAVLSLSDKSWPLLQEPNL